MNRTLGILLALALGVVAPASTASAQLLPAKAGAIVYGHHHLNTTNIDAFRKFWADTLGGTLVKIGTDNLEIVRFAGAVMFVRPMQAPTGGSKGTTVDHLGFSVPNLRRVIDKAKAGGYRIVTAQEAPANVPVKDDIGVVDAGGVTGIAYVMSPDDVKVELVEIKAQTAPIVSHHVHFFGEKSAEMRDWYIKVFGARAVLSTSPAFIRAELPRRIGSELHAVDGAGDRAPGAARSTTSASRSRTSTSSPEAGRSGHHDDRPQHPGHQHQGGVRHRSLGDR